LTRQSVKDRAASEVLKTGQNKVVTQNLNVPNMPDFSEIDDSKVDIIAKDNLESMIPV
jgi:hypothetical protein